MKRHEDLISHALPILSRNPYVQKVYLFGSCARNTENWNSDVDLFVIVDDAISNKEIRGLQTSAVPDDFRLPEVDIVVYRSGSLDETSFFISQTEQDRRLLYEKLL